MANKKNTQRCENCDWTEGGIVYDPFMGSGTTALATIHALGKRKFIGSEISEKYAKIAQERTWMSKSQTTLF